MKYTDYKSMVAFSQIITVNGKIGLILKDKLFLRESIRTNGI